MKRYLVAIGVVLMVCATAAFAFAQEKSADELAKESEDKANATAADKPTPEVIVLKVEEACKLLQTEGLKAFPKFKGKDSPFIFNGTYIWIHDTDSRMLMHPIKPKMENTEIIGLKDAGGKLFFGEMNQVAQEKGAGWVDYMWPKPGEKQASKKISYIKLCKADGKELIIGCGVYDITEEDIARMKK